MSSTTAPFRTSRLRQVIGPASWGLGATLGLSVLIVVGSRNLAHFDAALVGYTFAVLVRHVRHRPTATRCGCSARRRPCTGGAAGRLFFRPRLAGAGTLGTWVRRVGSTCFALNRFILARGRLRGLHALADHVGLPPRRRHHLPAGLRLDPLSRRCPATCRLVPRLRLRLPDVPLSASTRSSAFLIFHGLVWASFLVIAGVMLAMRRRMRDHGRGGACSSSARTSCR